MTSKDGLFLGNKKQMYCFMYLIFKYQKRKLTRVNEMLAIRDIQYIYCTINRLHFGHWEVHKSSNTLKASAKSVVIENSTTDYWWFLPRNPSTLQVCVQTLIEWMFPWHFGKTEEWDKQIKSSYKSHTTEWNIGHYLYQYLPTISQFQNKVFILSLKVDNSFSSFLYCLKLWGDFQREANSLFLTTKAHVVLVLKRIFLSSFGFFYRVKRFHDGSTF